MLHLAAAEGSLGTGRALVGLVFLGLIACFVIIRIAGASWPTSILTGIAGGSICGFVVSVGKHPLPAQAADFGTLFVAAFIATIVLARRRG